MNHHAAIENTDPVVLRRQSQAESEYGDHVAECHQHHEDDDHAVSYQRNHAAAGNDYRADVAVYRMNHVAIVDDGHPLACERNHFAIGNNVPLAIHQEKLVVIGHSDHFVLCQRRSAGIGTHGLDMIGQGDRVADKSYRVEKNMTAGPVTALARGVE